ncbi:MAG: FeoA domain-containing protein [Pirellulaceae bacterium]|nr:FeoA domain-containing protein [Pirellulaceae bacterium]
MHDSFPISLLQPGQRAVIDQLLGRADEVQRLRELGMHDGRPIEMIQAGSPCIVRLNGAKLCFRDCEGVSVLVRLGDVA